VSPLARAMAGAASVLAAALPWPSCGRVHLAPSQPCPALPADSGQPGNLINAVPGRAHVDGYSTSQAGR